MAVTGALAGALAVNGRTMGASVVAATLMAAGVDCARAGPAQTPPSCSGSPPRGGGTMGRVTRVGATPQFAPSRTKARKRRATGGGDGGDSGDFGGGWWDNWGSGGGGEGDGGAGGRGGGGSGPEGWSAGGDGMGSWSGVGPELLFVLCSLAMARSCHFILAQDGRGAALAMLSLTGIMHAR